MGLCLGKMPQPRPGQPGYNPNGQGQYGQGQYGQQQQHGQGGYGQQGGGHGQPGQFQDAGETKTDTGAPSPNGAQGGACFSSPHSHCFIKPSHGLLFYDMHLCTDPVQQPGEGRLQEACMHLGSQRECASIIALGSFHKQPS